MQWGRMRGLSFIAKDKDYKRERGWNSCVIGGTVLTGEGVRFGTSSMQY